MTREQIEHAIKCCNPYDENCGDCPFKDLPLGRCFEVLAKTAFNMLLEDRARLQKQVDEYKAKIEQGRLIELPCKVGDTVYVIIKAENGYALLKDICDGFMIKDGEVYIGLQTYNVGANKYYFTREEAEKRLKELQNG